MVGGDLMNRNIAFVMYTSIIGEGFRDKFKDNKEYTTILTTQYKDAELYLKDMIPDVVVVEVPSHSAYPLSYCLSICEKFKKINPACKAMLFITYTYLEDIFPEIIEARRQGQIDGFMSANNKVEEVIAGIKALS